MQKTIIEKYEKNGFQETTPADAPQHIRFFEQKTKDQQIIMIHVLFFYESFENLKACWEHDHQNYLVNYYYKMTEDNRSLAYNFYALFFVNKKDNSNKEYPEYSEIVLDMSFTRKYVFSDPGIFHIPGVFPKLSSQSDQPSLDLRAHWKKHLSGELSKIIFAGHSDSELAAECKKHLYSLSSTGESA